MEQDLEQANQVFANQLAHNVLCQCLETNLRGMTSDLKQEDAQKLQQCMANFMFSYALISDGWTRAINGDDLEKTDEE